MEIITIGDYYDVLNLRKICHDLKNGCDYSIDEIVGYLQLFVTSDMILIPVPSKNNAPAKIAVELARRKSATVSFCLKQYWSFIDTYQLKKEREITEDDICIIVDGTIPNGRLVLLDTVIGTGTTIRKCAKLLNNNCNLAISVTVDWKTYNNYERTNK